MVISHCGFTLKTRQDLIIVLLQCRYVPHVCCCSQGCTVCHYRRFAASGAITAEEQEQRTLYTNVLEYEQDHVSLQSIRVQVDALCWTYLVC